MCSNLTVTERNKHNVVISCYTAQRNDVEKNSESLPGRLELDAKTQLHRPAKKHICYPASAKAVLDGRGRKF